MEIASQVAKSKHEAEEAAKRAYRELLTKNRPDGVVSEEDVAATLAAMSVLNISVEQGESDARLYVAVVEAQSVRDEAAAKAEQLGPKGELSFGQELENMDAGLARDINALLERKRVLLARIARFRSAEETLSEANARLGRKQREVPRLCG